MYNCIIHPISYITEWSSLGTTNTSDSELFCNSLCDCVVYDSMIVR